MSTDETTTLTDGPASAPRESARPGVLILFTDGVAAERVRATGRRASVGRTPENHICLADPGVSRHHATLLREKHGGLRLVDEGSHNGTYVNGARVEGARSVHAGDVVRCGGTLLLIVEDTASYADWPGGAIDPPLLGGPAMRRVRRMVQIVAQQNLEVLIEGESGTGKEVVARMIQRESGRPGPFVDVNCAAIPANLFEAELFGVAKGAYTGADTDRPGLLAAAEGGTLLLDEVGELPLPLQAKLLRTLELRECRPLGAVKTRRVDLRLIAATNRDLREGVSRGAFREDLFHRLCGLTISLPALRERREDIAVLVEQTLEDVPGEGSPRSALTCPVMERLLLYRWPGNVRELQRTVQEALLRARADQSQAIGLPHLRPELRASEKDPADQLERIRQALRRCGGNVRQVAGELGLRRQRVYEILRENGLKAADFR